VDDVPGAQAPGARDLCVSGVAATEPAAFVEQRGPGGPVNRSVDAASAEQARVRGVDDRLGGKIRRDVPPVQADSACHRERVSIEA
jgi:hypothetical protein